MAFYRNAFGAAELLRNSLPDGRVLFVELAVGPARPLVSEETPSLGALAPSTIPRQPGAAARRGRGRGRGRAAGRGCRRGSGDAGAGDVLRRALRRRDRPVRPPLGAVDRPVNSSPPTTSPAAPRPRSSAPWGPAAVRPRRTLAQVDCRSLVRTAGCPLATCRRPGVRLPQSPDGAHGRACGLPRSPRRCPARHGVSAGRGRGRGPVRW